MAAKEFDPTEFYGGVYDEPVEKEHCWSCDSLTEVDKLTETEDGLECAGCTAERIAQ